MHCATVGFALTFEINEWISLFFPMCCLELISPLPIHHRKQTVFLEEVCQSLRDSCTAYSSQERLKAVEITFSDTDLIQSESNQCQMLKQIEHIQLIQQWDCILSRHIKYTGLLCHICQKNTYSALTKGLQRKGKKV